MKKELNYRWTANYNDSVPNNNYSDFIDTVIFDDENYDFSDYLSDRNICFEFCEKSNEYVILDADGEPTGERYLIVSEKSCCGNMFNKIKDARIAAGLTQKEASEILQIPKRTLENWEEGKRSCPVYVERLVVAALVNIKKS